MSQQPRHTVPEISSWQQALQWVYDRIDYERVRPSLQSNPFRLDRIRQMLTLIGSPQERIPAIHIAGTKGKGSTAAMLDSILRAAGIRSGLFTSPHIVTFEERMRVNGVMPDQQQLTSLVQQLVQLLEDHQDALSDRPPTFFEITTLLAWMYFQQQQAEVVVLETGLGGRLDCTNVCSPLVTLITSIGLDHTHILGNTLELIAAEKAGILKTNVPLIQGNLPAAAAEVVRAKAAQTNSPMFIYGRDFHVETSMNEFVRTAVQAQPQSFAGQDCFVQQDFHVVAEQRTYKNLRIPLVGSHQLHNASLAVMAADLLAHSTLPKITESSIRQGMAQTWWPLRFEVVRTSPWIILDAAHNPDSVSAVCATLSQFKLSASPRVLIFASSADKDAEAMLRILLPAFDFVVLTRFLGNPRATSPEELSEICDRIDPSHVRQISIAEHPESALRLAQQRVEISGLICVTGSIFLAAETRSLLYGNVSPFASGRPSHDA